MISVGDLRFLDAESTSILLSGPQGIGNSLLTFGKSFVISSLAKLWNLPVK
jgi:hypothetical protein